MNRFGTFGRFATGRGALLRICAYVDAAAMDEITTLQADVLRALAYPRRLQILHRLADWPAEVGILAAELGISQPNASQHLSVMRAAGVVEAERIGREVQYRVSDPDLIVACQTMRRVLERRYDRLASLTAGFRRSSSEATRAATVSTALPDER
jgi:ArsR family transcriptional regulator